MRARLIIFLVALFISVAAGASAQSFIALCYHGIEDRADDPDGMTLSTDRFIAQLSWLRENGYRPVGIDDLIAARDGKRPLPDKAVLLSFDDGFANFYTRVFPLLKLFDYPAVLALVGAWMDVAEGESVFIGDEALPRETFLSWDQVREMQSSGLVEIASHSFDMHHGIVANPQGNEQFALTARRYDPDTRSYESDEAYLRRIREDMAAGAALIARETGQRPRVIVWPYGKYNLPALQSAGEQGMEIALTLEKGVNRTDDLSAVRRLLITGETELPHFAWRLANPGHRSPRRVVHVDLDYVYDPDPRVKEENLGRLLDRIRDLQISTVYLQAFADPDGDGVADALYFPNRHLPMRADLFNRVAWQLRTRARVEVFAWMPVLGFDVGRDDLRVRAVRPEGEEPFDPDAYRRLSPFSPEARALIAEIYEDLAKHADFNGILFHDDAILSDFEDAHPQAMEAYRRAGFPPSIEAIRADAALKAQWSRFKTRHLAEWTDELTETVRIWRPTVKTARNLYARPVLEPRSEAWTAQSLDVFLEHYDYAAVMAMPYMENARHPERWLRRLVQSVAGHPEGLQRTVFELQSVDWRKGGKPLPSETLARQMRLLQSLGALNYGYYPDDFPAGHPRTEVLHGAFSLQTHPFREAP